MIINDKYNMPNEYVDGKDLRYLGVERLSDGSWHNFSEWEDINNTVWLQCRESDSIFKEMKRVK